jgi:hypothetical protein
MTVVLILLLLLGLMPGSLLMLVKNVASSLASFKVDPAPP